MDDTVAAMLIQGLYRRRKASQAMFAVIAKLFDKLLDPETGHVYYYNNKTGEAQWTKPMQSMLGGRRIMRVTFIHHRTVFLFCIVQSHLKNIGRVILFLTFDFDFFLLL
jgi:hypothetical protein